MADKIMKFGVFKKALCEMVASLLPDGIMEMKILSYGNVTPTWYYKTEGYKSALQAILIEHAKQELMRWSEPKYWNVLRGKFCV